MNDRWEVAVTVSDRGFQNVSFVNSISTMKGGRHVDYVADMLCSKLIENIRKKVGKGGMNIKPFQVLYTKLDSGNHNFTWSFNSVKFGYFNVQLNFNISAG